MPYKKIDLQKVNLESRYRKLREVAGDEYKYIQRFIRRAQIENNITDKTVRKYIDALLMAMSALGKRLQDVTKRDLEKLKTRLRDGRILSRNKQSYSDSSQREMTLIIARYLEWRFPRKFSDLKNWLVIRVKRKTPEVLKEEEVEKLLKACGRAEERFLIAVLFDSGFRAGEFINIRFEDIIEPTSDFPYYRIDLKREYSKTEGRVIGLYWKHSTKIIREYLSTCDRSDLKRQVSTKTYDAIRMFVSRLGRRVLRRRLHVHMFRKSSATYYASKLNRQQLCYRYGWRFSSNVPDVYIARAGLKEDEVKDRLLNTDLEKLQKENQEMESKLALMKDSSEREIGSLKKQLKELRGGSGVMPLLVSLATQQKQMSEVLSQMTGKRFDVVLPTVQKRSG